MEKLKKSLLSLFILISTTTFAQVVNLNPDTLGIPWLTGGVPNVTVEIQSEVDQLPKMTLRSTLTPPDSIDNSLHKFMRPIFDQAGGSCAQASGIGYIFTYEINWVRDSSANDTIYKHNWFPTHFTYNFLNEGSGGNGSFIYDGWDIVKEMGCPNIPSYGGLSITDTYWMSGYRKYDSAFLNRVDSLNTIDLDSTPQQGVDLIKQWLYDHNNEEEYGGLASFQTNMQACNIVPFLPGTPHEDEYLVYKWENPFGQDHMLTIVGYNDSICYDLDLNDTISSDEYGAFKVYNSNGPLWYENGYVYFPYKIFMQSGVVSPSVAYVVYVSEGQNDEVTLRVNMAHVCRDSIKLGVHWGETAESDHPGLPSNYYKALSFNGGSFPLLGDSDYDPIELTLEFSHFYSDKDFGKLFLYLKDRRDIHDSASLNSFSLVDRRWGETFELFSDYNNTPIEETYNWFHINYDLIPHESPITTTDTLFSDMVSRFNPQVSNGASLLVEKGVNIDMYNSDITINSECTLTLEDSITITAKRDTCRIVIDGEINIGKHINFIAEDSALLEIKLNNGKLITTFDSVNFERCKIFNNGKEINIKNSDFNDCQQIYSGYGKVTIDKCDLTKTGIHLLNPEEEDFLSTISNCDLVTNNTGTLPGIRLQDCNRFLVYNNTIDGYFTGIDLRFSGTDQSTDKKVYDNTIDSCSFNGISTYYSTVLIEGNNIQNNLRGISFFNNSTTEVLGDEGATSNEESQQISNNSSYELYSSLGSFPWSIQFNVIHDSDNGSTDDPIVYTEINPGQLIPDTFDIRYNCWDANFDSVTDLKPSYPFYKIKPKACPGSKKSASAKSAEPMYRTGLDQFADEQYSTAQSTFQSVVEQSPGSVFSLAAMKSMFDVEQFVNDDYYTLQDYYLTNTSIVSDSSMKTLGIFLANRCNLSTKQWQAAIDHYEDIIVNPPTPDDSVFAIIDLGYTYLLMQNSAGRYVAMGKMTEYIPDSDQDFEAKSTNLLKLLPFVKSNNQANNDETINTDIKENRLLQSIPNPTNGITEISFMLNCQNRVIISILNNMGSKLKANELVGKEGKNSFVLNMSDLSPGIYYYTLEMDNRIVDIQKVVVVR
jgi:type IX secretion system substrate protein